MATRGVEILERGPMVDKEWHHIAGTYDGRTKRIYGDIKHRTIIYR